MYKKIIVFVVIILITSTSVFAVWKGINKPSKEENLKSKINEEMDYVERSIINLANELNNISIENYKVSAKTSSSQNQTQQNSTSESGSDSGSSSGSESEQSKSEGSSNSSSSNTTLLYKMVPIDQASDQIDWNQIQNDLNNLYNTWSQVVLDLYKINTNNDDILAFGRDLDETTKYIKSNDKINALSLVAKLYNYIPKFINSYSPEDTRKIYLQSTKTNILNAYSLIEQEKWEEIKNQINLAEQNYNKILNDIDKNKNQYNVNKAYILLKEFQNSIDLNDKDVLYLRYKNLIQEMININ